MPTCARGKSSSSAMPSPAEVHAFERAKREGLDTATSLQLGELVKSNTPDYSRLSKLRKFVEEVLSTVVTVPKTSFAEKTYSSSFPELSFVEAGDFPAVTFEGSVQTQVVGSFVEETVVKHNQTVDVVVSLPASAISGKDHNQSRYLNKRTLFLGVLRDHLKFSLKSPAEFAFVNLPSLDRPVLKISVPGSSWSLHVISVPPAGVFEKEKLSSPQCAELFARHNYQAIIRDLEIACLSKVPSKLGSRAQTETAVLVKLLVQQCWGLGDTVSGFTIGRWLRETVQLNQLPLETSVLHLLKLTVKHLAVSSTDALIGNFQEISLKTLLTEELRRRAKLLCAQWQTGEFNAVEVFRKRREISDFSLTAPRAGIEDVVARLKTGLTDRVHAFTARLLEQERVEIRGFVNATTANRLMDKGPAASSAEAKSFREFWGGKTEIRRFKDASVLECVIFKASAENTENLISDHSSEPSVLADVIARSLSGLTGPFALSVHPLGGSYVSSQEEKNKKSALLEKVKTLVQIDGVKSVVKSCGMATLLRSTEVATPVPTAAGKISVLVAEVAGEAEEDWEATSRELKIRWLVKILKNLREQKISTAEIWASETTSEPFLDLEMDGSYFRVFAFHQREQADSGVQHGSLSLLQQNVDALCFEHPAMEATLSLVQKWTDNRLANLDDQLHQFVVSSVAQVFASVGNFAPVGSAHVGFLRWLQLVTETEEISGSPATVERLKTQAAKALALAESGEFQKLMTVTDNGSFFDFTVKLCKKTPWLQTVAALKTSKSVMAVVEVVGASEKHRLLGLRLNRAIFTKNFEASDVTAGDLVLSCVEAAGDSIVMVPDVVWLVAAVGSLLDGYVEKWL